MEGATGATGRGLVVALSVAPRLLDAGGLGLAGLWELLSLEDGAAPAAAAEALAQEGLGQIGEL